MTEQFSKLPITSRRSHQYFLCSSRYCFIFKFIFLALKYNTDYVWYKGADFVIDTSCEWVGNWRCSISFGCDELFCLLSAFQPTVLLVLFTCARVTGSSAIKYLWNDWHWPGCLIKRCAWNDVSREVLLEGDGLKCLLAEQINWFDWVVTRSEVCVWCLASLLWDFIKAWSANVYW